MNNAASHLISQARNQSGLSLREIGRRAGTSHATLSAYIKGTKCPSMNTLLRIIEACDMSLDLSLTPRIRRSRGLARGEELAQVLHLAAQFPARHRADPRLPVFSKKVF